MNIRISSIRRLALYLLFFSINFEIWDPLNTGGVFSISKLAGYLYLLTLINELPVFLRIETFKKYVLPLLLFFVYLCIVNFLNINAVSSRFIDFSILQDIILFILLVNHERKDPGILLKGMQSFAAGSLCLAICFYLGIGVSSELGRVTIFGDNQNVIGVKEAIGSVIVMLLILRNPASLKRWRYVFLLFLPLMLLLMADTGSRVAFFSFGLMFLAGITLYKTKKGYAKLLVLALGLGTGILLWRYLSESQVLYNRLQLTEKNQDIGGRDRVWKEIVPFIMENPIFGQGQSGYTKYMTRITGGFFSPHNVILEILCYTGCIGLLFYLLFLFRIFVISFRKYKTDGSLMQVLLLMPILGLLLSGQLLTVKIGYIIFALSTSGLFAVKKNETAKKYLLKRRLMKGKTDVVVR